MASAPSPNPSPPRPGPGTALGSGKTQKAGSISANNSAAAFVSAARGSRAARRRAAGRRGLGAGPCAAGARCEAGVSLNATESPRGAFRAAARRRRRGGETEKRKSKTYLGAEGSAELRLRTPDAAGVWPGGSRRKALAQPRAGLHFARTGNSPWHPAPPRAPRCRRTDRRRHAPHCPLRAGGSLPAARGRTLLRRPHPVTSAALRAFLFHTSTGDSAVSVLQPPLSPRASAAPSAPNFP